VNPWAGMSLPVLLVCQDGATLSLPIYEANSEQGLTWRLIYLAERADQTLLRDTGMVLPSREWWVEQS